MRLTQLENDTHFFFLTFPHTVIENQWQKYLLGSERAGQALERNSLDGCYPG